MNYLKKFFFGATLAALLPAGALAQALQLSDDEQDYWYRICSASGEAKGLAITDNMEKDAAVPLTLESASDSETQQWKLVAEGDGVVFINRATGHILQPASNALSLYNLTRLQTTLVPGRSFVLTELGEGQRAIGGQEADSEVRYLVAQNKEQAYAFATQAQANSQFAWTFELQEHVITAVDGISAAKATVKVVGGRICVEPKVPFCVYASNGALVDAARPLSPGVYVVAMAGYKTSVLVK